MPNCFQLFKKGESDPVNLNALDADLCKLLGVPVHEKRYVCGWFDSIGWRIACMDMRLGSKELRERIVELVNEHDISPDLLKILDYLEERYTSVAWAQIGKAR